MTESAQKSSVQQTGASHDTSKVDRQVPSAIRTGLHHFGPDSLVDNLTYMLELDYSVNIDSVSNDITSLKAALSKMFGGAAYVVESKICQALAKQLGIDGEGKSLEKLVELLKESEKVQRDELRNAA